MKMSGLKSRRKGMANEYKLRDYFRSLGYISNRVPSSGAAEGFKGDLTVGNNAFTTTNSSCVFLPKSMLIELKVRQNEFKSIYALFDMFNGQSINLMHAGMGIYLSYQFTSLVGDLADISEVYLNEIQRKTWGRTLQKLVNMQKLVKTCDFLVIKIDYKPFIFIKYV